jgi:hypothetical protein
VVQVLSHKFPVCIASLLAMCFKLSLHPALILGVDDNVMVEEDTVSGLLDFEFCAYDWWVDGRASVLVNTL